MSNFLAVATVTAVLRDLLQEAAGAAVNGATVTTRRPEAANDGGQHKPAVNIFLYRVTPNSAWRNTDIEIRYPDAKAPHDPARDRIEKRPQVPLNLDYLFSFYGNELDLEPQRLLGGVIGALHAQTRLSPDRIRRVVQENGHLRGSSLDPNQSKLDPKSYLDFQVAHIEKVKLTPIALSLDELSKLWSVFFQVPYALSVAYEATAVLIEPGAPRVQTVVQAVHVEPPKPIDKPSKSSKPSTSSPRKLRRFRRPRR